MNDPKKITGFKSTRRRDIRRSSVSESISRSRTTILINMVIEIACAIILIIGFLYFIRFLFHWRDRMVELYFNIFLGAIIFFAFGWSVYIFLKLRKYYILFKEIGKREE